MEVDKGTMTVLGRFDAKKLRGHVANKTRKKVDLVGGSTNNKVDSGGGGNNKQGGGGGNQHKGANEEDGKQADKEYGGGEQEGKEKDKGDRQEEEGKGKDNNKAGGGGGGKEKGGGKFNKPVMPVVATVVLKIGSTGLHCYGYMNRIRGKFFKIKGVEQVHMDMGKNQVTVTVDGDHGRKRKALPEKLRKKLRRPVDVVALGKDKDGKDKDEKDGGGGGGKEKDGEDAATMALTAELEAWKWKVAFYDQQSLINAKFMLSDENPNACAVM